jgi:CBS domain-containing protein
MFYVRSIGGYSEVYQPGSIRAERKVLAISSPDAPTGISDNLPHKDLPQRAPRTPVRDQGIAAYETASAQVVRPNVSLAGEIMTHEVVSVAPSETNEAVRELFQQNRFHHLPIVDQDKRVVGIISDRDLLRSIIDRQAAPLSELMVKKVLTALPETPIHDLASTLFHEKIGCIPITSADGKLVGIITRSDLLRCLMEVNKLQSWG